MEFFINKGSTLNILKLELIQDGRTDFNRFFQSIQNANIYFTMTDIVTGVTVIAKKLAGTQLVNPCYANGCLVEEYYITYQFSSKETYKAGRFVGQFSIEFLDGSGILVMPVSESLFINILDHGLYK